MLIQFSKWHGLGNDFMLIDGTDQAIALETLPICEWADRHTGIGFDQLLLLLPSISADVCCRIFNSDGSEAEQCGNGMRCVAAYWHATQRAKGDDILIETLGGPVISRILKDHEVEVTLGKPVLLPGWVELNIHSAEKSLQVFALSIGNPHAVLQVKNLDEYPIETIGKEISHHPDFPQGVNVGFIQLLDKHNLKLITYERGVGQTLACGSNACAAAVSAILNGDVRSPTNVHVSKGQLTVKWEGAMKPVINIGKVAQIFNGELCI